MSKTIAIPWNLARPILEAEGKIRDYRDHECAVADIIDEGTFNETGGELGRADWEFAQAQ